MIKSKPFCIDKELVWDSYLIVKENKGSAGVDQQSLDEFEMNRERNLYKIWNRLSSGTYFPKPVKGVAIPKKQGGSRMLGIPTVEDRIAQTAAKLVFEPIVEAIFLPDSYGYRPNKSALDAVRITRTRCWKYNWCIKLDIKGLFDNIDHELLMDLVVKHIDIKWIILCIKRWLKSPMQDAAGNITQRLSGTPQGGVISPVLSNLFLHYVFDSWITENFQDNQWCRYADDAVVHCRTKDEAEELLEQINLRFQQWKLQLNLDKTKIIYCKDSNRKLEHNDIKFDFLGYEFRPRKAVSKYNVLFLTFSPAISPESKKSINKQIKDTNIGNRSDLSIEQISRILNPMIIGWINYYGKFNRSSMIAVMRRVNLALVKWCRKKYKALKKSKIKAIQFLERLVRVNPKLFAHWNKEIQGSFV